jgi:hypothetical protein
VIAVKGYSPEDLLKAARDLVSRPDLRSKGVWPRAAAHLCRQALEETLDAYWKARAPGLELASMRAQLAALPAYLNRELAGEVAFTWRALSSACHHHVYELAPTAQELSLWTETIERLMEATKKRA